MNQTRRVARDDLLGESASERVTDIIIHTSIYVRYEKSPRDNTERAIFV